jgi:hypothetical protein
MLHLTRQARHKTVLGFAKFEGWEDDHRKDVGGESDLWSNSLSIFRLYPTDAEIDGSSNPHRAIIIQ